MSSLNDLYGSSSQSRRPAWIDEKHWPPLRGVIDWPAFITALRDIDYRGPLNYEAALEGETPAQRLAFLEDNYANLIS